jgi:hypothetical protein
MKFRDANLSNLTPPMQLHELLDSSQGIASCFLSLLTVPNGPITS